MGTLAERNRLWREFRSFVRQAKAYDHAASNVSGVESGLLQYYAQMNLAKAEILISKPDFLSATKVRHGLVHRRGRGGSIAGDFLEVTPGVFSLLYEKRMQQPIPIGTRIPIKRLLGQIPEVGWELHKSQLGAAAAVPVVHVVVADDDATWSLLASPIADQLELNTITWKEFGKSFEEIPHWPSWREVFHVTRRTYGQSWRFFQHKSRLIKAGAVGSPQVLTSDLSQTAATTWRQLEPMIEYSSDGDFDAWLCPSLLKSKMIPMRASLARYALMFFVSSLVRYQPSKLDPLVQANQAWLLSAFTSESHLPLLADALNGISLVPYYFRERGALRTG